MPEIVKGPYRVRVSRAPGDMAAALALRSRCFRADTSISDRDRFDDTCQHVLLEEIDSDRLIACYRLGHYTRMADILHSYSGQFYGLSRLAAHPGPAVEIGRFCVDPDVSDPDILRLLWGALARYIDNHQVALLFGCSSFNGVDPKIYAGVFAQLARDHLAPPALHPDAIAPDIHGFAQYRDCHSGVKMPPLLQSYLALGGWVSDHAVIDRDLGTIHVFTAVEVANIPPIRARLLRAILE